MKKVPNNLSIFWCTFMLRGVDIVKHLDQVSDV